MRRWQFGIYSFHMIIKQRSFIELKKFPYRETFLVDLESVQREYIKYRGPKSSLPKSVHKESTNEVGLNAIFDKILLSEDADNALDAN